MSKFTFHQIATLAILSTLLLSTGACACSCMRQPDDIAQAVEQAYQSADAVVLAQAQTSGEGAGAGQGIAVTRFTTWKYWRGQPGKEFNTRMATHSAMCGMQFTGGSVYLLYLNGPDQNGFYQTNLCTRTAPAGRADADADIVQLNQLVEQRPPVKPAPQKDCSAEQNK